MSTHHASGSVRSHTSSEHRGKRHLRLVGSEPHGEAERGIEDLGVLRAEALVAIRRLEHAAYLDRLDGGQAFSAASVRAMGSVAEMLELSAA